MAPPEAATADGGAASFETLGLKEPLLFGVYGCGFRRPSPVQRRALPPVLSGRDVVVQSQSGTGKSCVFCLGALQVVTVANRTPQAVILSPTRELAEQSQRVCKDLGQYLHVKVHCAVGQKRIAEDSKEFASGVHVVSGTPGRVLHLMKDRTLPPTAVKFMVLDEADEILTLGFESQVRAIHGLLPPNVQVVLVSATLTEKTLTLAHTFMRDPLTILLKPDEITLEGIKQFYVEVESEEWKVDALLGLYEDVGVTQSVVFCNSRAKVEWLARRLQPSFSVVGRLHGEMKQENREDVVRKFRAGQSRVLVATDVFGRGLDVPAVSLVMNFDLPKSNEFYVHRIGRSGRFGRRGVAVSLVAPTDAARLKDIERFCGVKVARLPKQFSQLL